MESDRPSETKRRAAFGRLFPARVASQISGVSARVRRKLSILQDEAKLAARNTAVSEADTHEKQTVPAPAGILEAHNPVPHAKPHL